MPLRGLFSKKNKSRTDVGDSAQNSSTESPLTSPTADYIKPDSLLPSSPNGRSSLHPDDAHNSPTKSTKSSVYPSVASGSSPASSSKLRLPFGRKRAAKSNSSANDSEEQQHQQHVDVKLSQPRPPFPGRLSISAVSESDAADVRRNLGPPPSRSAIFSAYGDPHSANSTRSLPSEYPASVQTTETLVDPPPVVPKRPLFPWSSKSQPNTTKAKSKANITPPKAEDISIALADPSTFNLKAFRHLRPPSPELVPPPVHESTILNSANTSSTSLIPPPPIPGTRSRNASLGSLNDPSASQQRISVAAFREAQARRSLAGSPVPSARSPSPGPILSAHSRSPPSNPVNDARPRRTSMVALGKDTYSSDSEESSESEEEDNNVKLRAHPGRKDMVKSKAKSEIGHGTSPTSPHSTYNAPSSFSRGPGIGLRPDALAKSAVPRSQSDVYGKGVYGSRTNLTASASTSALASNTDSATKATSPQPKINAESISNHEVKSTAGATITGTHSAPKAPTPRSNSDSDSDDSDNAPLATLIPPKRPGSAASNRSNPQSQSDAISVRSMGRAGGLRARVNSNAMPKPLIDINELTGPNKRPVEVGIGSKPKSLEGFTGGATLLSTTVGPSSVSPGPSSVTSTSPPGRRFISPPPSPPSGSRSARPPPRSESTSPQILSQAPSGLAQRRMQTGKLKDTDALSMTSSRTTGSSNSNDGNSGPGKKKDLFSERLSKAVAQTVSTSSSPSTTPGSPPLPSEKMPRALRRESTPVKPSFDESGELDIPFTSSPSPGLENPDPGHKRRRSSDLVELQSVAAALQAPSPKPFETPKRNDFNHKAKRKIVEPKPKPKMNEDNTESMEDLATLLGAGIKLVTVNGEDPEDTDLPYSAGIEKEPPGADEEKDDMNSFAHLAYSDEPPPSPNRIAPIVIKTRPPAPSFSVTSRPNHGRGASVNILTTSSSSETAVMNSTAGNLTTTTTTTTTTQTTGPPSAGVTRPRSSTLVSPSSSKPSLSSWSVSPIPSIPKAKTSLLSSVPPAPASVASSNTSSSSGATSNSSKSGSGNASSVYESTTSRKREQIVQPSSSSTKTLKPPPRSMSAGTTSPAASRFPVPSKPFANVNESPASSTGGSSSGKGVPNTPRDGSEIGDGSGRRWSPSKEEQWGSGVSGLSFGGKHGRKRSIAFDDDGGAEGKGKESPEHDEARRKERRRSEARAAIELGNTINGPGPVLDDDDDEDLPITQSLSAARMNTMNPMMMNGPMPGLPGGFGPQATGNPMWGWPSVPQMPHVPTGQMLSPAQFMVPPPADPSFYAAHQQAMMFAKQAYQMAVAQQAMAAAAEEWERGSTVGFNSSQSMYGMPPSVAPMGSPYALGGGNGWSGSPGFTTGPRSSMYGGSGAMSEYGGGGGRNGGWNSSRSVYGESFGPSTPHGGGGQAPDSAMRGRMSTYSRDSGYFPPVPPIPPQGNKNSASKQSASPRSRTVSQPAQPARHYDGGGGSPSRRAPPPSSWKKNGA